MERTQPIQSKCYACTEYGRQFFVNDIENPYTTPDDKPFYWIRSRQATITVRGSRIEALGADTAERLYRQPFLPVSAAVRRLAEFVQLASPTMATTMIITTTFGSLKL